MKQYYYLDGLDKIGPFTEEELLSKNLSDDVLILDTETNECFQYKNIKNKIVPRESTESGKQTSVKNNTKEKSSKSLVVKIVIGIIAIGALITPKIISAIMERETESKVNEMIMNGMLESPLEEYNTFVNSDISFKYPRSYTIVNDTITDTGIHLIILMEDNEDGTALICYWKITKTISLEEKCKLCKENLNTTCKDIVFEACENVKFDDIITVDDKGPAIYKMNFKFSGGMGQAMTVIGEELAYWSIIVSGNEYYFNVMNRYFNEIKTR